MKSIIQLILAITLVVIGFYPFKNGLSTELLGAGIVIIITLIYTFISDIIKNRKRIKLWVTCGILALRKQNIRFSMSYLYRIKVEGKYLLVKNSNYEFYQPVGGKYKRLQGTQNLLKDKFNAIDDLKLPDNGLMKDDYALFMPAKRALRFIDWFNKGNDREVSHWREFYEELVQGKAEVLSKENFPYIFYNHVKTILTPVKKVPEWDNCYEIIQYDILDFIPTSKQEIELKELLAKGDTDYYKWADIELINDLGFNKTTRNQPYRIGPHTKWAINLKIT